MITINKKVNEKISEVKYRQEKDERKNGDVI